LCDNNGGSFCDVELTADLFGTICAAFFSPLKLSSVMIILLSLGKGFVTKVKITTKTIKPHPSLNMKRSQAVNVRLRNSCKKVGGYSDSPKKTRH